jgi:tetratricopeptide (TPR) repeat protein
MSLCKALEENDRPGIAMSCFGWAISLIDQNKFDDAIHKVHEARARLGDYLDLHFLELLYHHKKGEARETLEACEKYLGEYDVTELEETPYLSNSRKFYPEVLWTASDAAWKQAEFKKSLEYQEKTVSIDPANHYRRIVYASNLGKEGRIEEAISVLDGGLRLCPHEMAFENAKALVYGDSGKYDMAFDVLNRILKRNSRDVDALINMGVVSEKKGDYANSEHYFKKALAIDPEHDVALSNLKHLKDAIDTRPQKISLCMIVKDEERFLPGCLRSVQGLVDEIIMVDTGSSDKTMEIAREFGARIFQHPWQNDFSLHRNQSIDYATGDWILILDADEELDPADHHLIRSAIMRKNIDAVSFVVYNKIQGGRTGFLNSHRMFRSGKGYHYSGIVHNQLIMDGPALSSQFKVFHHGYGLSDEQMRIKGKRTEALLKKQLEENPDNAFAHFNLAQIYRGLGEPASSLEHAKRVIDILKPSDIDRRHVYVMALDQIGCAYVGLEQLDRAKEYFHKALEIKDDYLDPLFNLGYVYSREGDFDRADEIFNRYLRVRAAFAEHREWIGLILNNLNSQFAVYFGLGLSQFVRRNTDKALEYFQKVIDQVGDFEFTHHLMARCYRARGQFKQVLHHCEKAIEFGHEDTEIYLLKGEAYLNLKDSLGASGCFEESLKLDSNYSPSLLGLAAAASVDGDYEKALELVNEALANSPKSPQALAAKGDLLYYAGQYGSAANSYRNQSELNPDDPISLNNLANCFLKQGNFASAEFCYRRALKASPDFGLGYRNLAVLLVRQKKNEDAVSFFEKYLTFSPDDSEVHVVLADLYYQLKEYWKAISHYEHHIRKNPRRYEVILRLADCYFNLGRLDSAMMGYRAMLAANPGNIAAATRLRELERFSQPVKNQ